MTCTVVPSTFQTYGSRKIISSLRKRDCRVLSDYNLTCVQDSIQARLIRFGGILEDSYRIFFCGIFSYVKHSFHRNRAARFKSNSSRVAISAIAITHMERTPYEYGGCRGDAQTRLHTDCLHIMGPTRQWDIHFSPISNTYSVKPEHGGEGLHDHEQDNDGEDDFDGLPIPAAISSSPSRFRRRFQLRHVDHDGDSIPTAMLEAVRSTMTGIHMDAPSSAFRSFKHRRRERLWVRIPAAT